MPYQESPHFETPCHTKPLWRYMHIDKFMSMLYHQSLHFPNIYVFKDIYEGALSEESLKAVYKTNLLDEQNTPIKQDKYFESTKNDIEQLPEGRGKKERLAQHHSFDTLLTTFSNHLMFCNGWFLNDNESHSMWAEYGDKSPTSIAIKTTVGDLINSLKYPEENIYKRVEYAGANIHTDLESYKYNIHIGKVKYIDYENDHIDGYEHFRSIDLTIPDDVLKLFYAPIMHKRNIYADEHEVRVVISFESICDKFLDKVYTSDIPFYSHKIVPFSTGESFSYINKYEDPDTLRVIDNILSVKINLERLINEVVISPNLKGYYEVPLRKLMDDNNLNGGLVRTSQIKEVLEKVSLIE